MTTAFEVVMESRRELVEKIIQNMEKGYVLTKSGWDREALAPFNPLSQTRYRGGNRLRLIQKVLEKEYKDPRWMTAKQLKDKGYYIKKGEHGVLCEKWLFEKEKTLVHEDGTKEKIEVPLEHPVVRYFWVFNGEQVQEFPDYKKEGKDNSENLQAGYDCIRVSECPIVECAQPEAFYSPRQDKIFLPLKELFKDPESYVKTALHEMVHSTGHPTRLKRDLSGPFGSPEYAREELRAELGSIFLESDLGIKIQGEHFQDHSNYLISWIGALKEDYNELFRACAQADTAAERIYQNYLLVKKPEKEKTREKENDRSRIHKKI